MSNDSLDHSDIDESGTQSPVRLRLLVASAVFLSFYAFAAIRSPVPGVNEPHYLAKAKYFWDSGWIQGDFFLDSYNAHWFFYWFAGQLTRVMSLEWSAWTGRAVALFLLAFGWTELVSRLAPGRWSSLWAAWLFLLMQAVGHFSGEWMVGGVEGKVFSFGLTFWAIACCIDKKWNRAAAFTGLSISFHPVVGMWALLGGLFALSVQWWLARRQTEKSSVTPLAVVRKAIAPIILLIVCQLPGMIPALDLLKNENPNEGLRSCYLQVLYRLGHHLDPTRFPTSAFVGYSLLALFWVLARRWNRRPNADNFLAWFVIASAGMAISGLIIGFWPRPGSFSSFADLEQFSWNLRLLKFYPFRLFDIMMPAAVSVLVVQLTIGYLSQHELRRLFAWLVFVSMTLVSAVLAANADNLLMVRLAIASGCVATVGLTIAVWPRSGCFKKVLDLERLPWNLHHLIAFPFRLFGAMLRMAVSLPVVQRSVKYMSQHKNRQRVVWLLFGSMMLVSVLLPAADRDPSFLSPAQSEDWREICSWISESSPSDAVFLTEQSCWAFKWYANRAEYVTFKDCPQDAAGLIEWNRRLRTRSDWGGRWFDDGYSREAMRNLRERTGVTHIVVRKLGPIELEPVRANATFKVYDLRAEFEEPADGE